MKIATTIPPQNLTPPSSQLKNIMNFRQKYGLPDMIEKKKKNIVKILDNFFCENAWKKNQVRADCFKYETHSVYPVSTEGEN